MTSLALTPADEARRHSLRRMRLVATLLLVAAAALYLVTLHRDGVWGYANAFAEAGMVGGLADWFAVTALFRHPLGLPVPHTALVPKKKDLFAKSLEDFVTGHFLTGEAARERLVSSGAVVRIGTWLADPDNARRAVGVSARVGNRALAHIKDADVRAVVRHTVIPGLQQEPLGPIAGALLAEVVEDGMHRGAVDLVLDEAIVWLTEHPETFIGVVGERMPSWTPGWIDDLVSEKAHAEAVKWARDVRADSGHRVRLALDELLRELAHNLQHDETTMARTDAVKDRFLTHPQTVETVMGVWGAFRRTVSAALADPDGQLHARLVEETTALGRRLVDDEALRAVVETRAGEFAAWGIETYGAELAPVISQVIARWDGKEAAERIELHVGRDLQFIRINGTLVGGMAGLVIHAVSQVLTR